MGFYRTMALSFAGAGLFSGIQYLAPTVTLFGLGQFGFGFFTMGGVTSISGAIPEMIGSDEAGSAYGINAAAMNIGNCLGPVLGGSLAHVCGTMGPVFLLSFLLQVISAGYIYGKFIRK